jgi:hypothetical protein
MGMFGYVDDGVVPLTPSCWTCPRTPASECLWRDSRMVIFSIENTTRVSATFDIEGGMGYMLSYTLADYGSSPGVWMTELQGVGGPVFLSLTDRTASPFQPTNQSYYVYIPSNISAINFSFIARQVCAMPEVISLPAPPLNCYITLHHHSVLTSCGGHGPEKNLCFFVASSRPDDVISGI